MPDAWKPLLGLAAIVLHALAPAVTYRLLDMALCMLRRLAQVPDAWVQPLGLAAIVQALTNSPHQVVTSEATALAATPVYAQVRG